MVKNQTINLAVVESVALALEELKNEVVFVGGAVVSIYVTDEGADQPRPTKDIDITVQVSSYSQMENLREKLASKGIFPSPESTVMYRYKYDDIQIDFIPWDATPLGPTNSWLKPGFDHAESVTVGKTEIKVLTVPYFLASKWEAYRSRGSDPRTSHDFEDIIYVLDNNLNVVDSIQSADEGVKRELCKMANGILSMASMEECIECHINPYTAEERKNIVVDKVKMIATVQS